MDEGDPIPPRIVIEEDTRPGSLYRVFNTGTVSINDIPDFLSVHDHFVMAALSAVTRQTNHMMPNPEPASIAIRAFAIADACMALRAK